MNKFNQNDKFLLHEIQLHYDILKNDKKNELLNNIFSNFSYHFFKKENGSESELLNTLKDFKLIIAKIINNNKSNGIIITVENQCFLVKNLDADLIISGLEKMNISLINLNSKNLDQTIYNEIYSFCSSFETQIKHNKFVRFLIHPVAAFLIRRFYYPSNFFSNPSFFSFKPIKKRSFLDTSSIFLSSKETIIKKISYKNGKDKVNIYHAFQKKDFIVLRTIYSNESAIFNLVFHKQTLCILIFKQINMYNVDEHSYSNEINFCQKMYRHRCIIKCYGFVEENKQKIGFVYEYMSNGTLINYFTQKKISNFFSFSSLLRICDGIDYLHSHSVIHRDIKHLNILINHDNKCYISDFDRVKIVDENNTSPMSIDFASVFYASPEQQLGKDIHGNKVSFPTDIYSLGLLMYFIFEQKDLIKLKNAQLIINFLIKNVDHIHFNKMPKNIQNIFKQCIKIDPNERPTIKEIKQSLYQFANSFYFLDQYFIDDQKNDIYVEEICQYFYENLLLISENTDTKEIGKKVDILNNLLKSLSKGNISEILYNIGYIYHYNLKDYSKAYKYYIMSEKYHNSYAQLKLGHLFYNGFYVKQDYLMAKEYYEKSAKQNNLESYYYLGFLYFYGDGIDVDYKMAKHYFELAAKSNNSDALYCLGNIYSDGLDVDIDYEKAKKYYELSAKLKNPNALYCLGDMYYHGLGVEKDYKKTLDYFEMAAKQNSVEAIYNLGKLYYNGEGVEKNYNKAINYLELAAAENYSYAQNFIGELYCNGIFYEKNYETARIFFEKAAEQNNPNAFYNLGNIYMKGLGVIKNYQKAKYYLKLSADGNNSDALNSLGYIYYKGLGENVDFKKAEEYFLNSANLNNNMAFYNLGDLFYHGYGEPKDFYRAKHYFELAVKQNNTEAMFNLGKMYYETNGINNDYKEVFKYYEMSARMNNSNALYNLGKLYFDGIGVKQNFEKAKQYFLIASYFQNPEAIFHLGLLYFNGLLGEKNIIKAYEYFYLASEKKNINAYFYIGLIYERGEGVERDIEKAIFFYSKCAEKRQIKYFYDFKSGFQEQTIDNYCFYAAMNKLSLIYIIDKNMDLENAEKYLKTAGLNEFTLAQNNLGIYYLLILNEKGNAKYMFKKSSKKRFDLAEFNIGLYYEKELNNIKAIKHYLKSLEYQNNPVFNKNHIINDDQLEISRLFINCYVNLKITSNYFMDESKIENIGKHLINAIFRPLYLLLIYSDYKSFQFEFYQNENRTNLKDFLLGNPLFHIQEYKKNKGKGWSEIKLNKHEKNNAKCILIKSKISRNKNDIKQIDITKNMHHDYNNRNNRVIQSIKSIFYDFKNLYGIEELTITKRQMKNQLNFISSKDKVERKLIFPDDFLTIFDFRDDINDIITEMDKFLFNPPYSILFGRIPIYEANQIKKLSDLFYEGFGIKLNDE